MKSYYIYIMTNQARGTLYIGMTNSLLRRIEEHVQGIVEGFSKRHRPTRLVYFEESTAVSAAITREKQLKSWHRQWKINLNESVNPQWQDLLLFWGMDSETSSE